MKKTNTHDRTFSEKRSQRECDDVTDLRNSIVASIRVLTLLNQCSLDMVVCATMDALCHLIADYETPEDRQATLEELASLIPLRVQEILIGPTGPSAH